MLAAPARADVLTFADLAGYGSTVGGTSVVSGQFTLSFSANTSTGGTGDTVGQLVTPGVADCASTLACPVNDPSTYYAALNAGVLEINTISGASMSLQGFDASFIGSSTATGYPATAALLGVQGTTADGTAYFENYALSGPDANGFEFSQYASSAAFSSLQFTDIVFFVYTCDADGNCSFSGSPSEQFAIDNINIDVNALPTGPTGPAPVPEPSSVALFGLGLAGLAAMARRRRPHAAPRAAHRAAHRTGFAV